MSRRATKRPRTSVNYDEVAEISEYLAERREKAIQKMAKKYNVFDSIIREVEAGEYTPPRRRRNDDEEMGLGEPEIDEDLPEDDIDGDNEVEEDDDDTSIWDDWNYPPEEGFEGGHTCALCSTPISDARVNYGILKCKECTLIEPVGFTE